MSNPIAEILESAQLVEYADPAQALVVEQLLAAYRNGFKGLSVEAAYILCAESSFAADAIQHALKALREYKASQAAAVLECPEPVEDQE